MRLTRRFVVKSLDNIALSRPIRYERYYVNNQLRIQKKGSTYEKEVLNEENELLEKIPISEDEFLKLKDVSATKIIRDSYLYLGDENVSIKRYYDVYDGLNRVEVKFLEEDEMNTYNKELWMGEEITSSPLAFDKDLSKLNREQFLVELKKYL